MCWLELSATHFFHSYYSQVTQAAEASHVCMVLILITLQVYSTIMFTDISDLKKIRANKASSRATRKILWSNKSNINRSGHISSFPHMPWVLSSKCGDSPHLPLPILSIGKAVCGGQTPELLCSIHSENNKGVPFQEILATRKKRGQDQAE